MVFYKAGCSWGVRVGLMGSVSRGVNLKGDGGISWHRVVGNEDTDIVNYRLEMHFLLCFSAEVELTSHPPEASILTSRKMRKCHSVPFHCVRSV